MRARLTKTAVAGTILVALGLSVASSADAVSLNDACSEKATAHCPSLATACVDLRRCITSPKAGASPGCVSRGVQDLEALRACTPCRDALGGLAKEFAACKKSA